jgi:hypothetical protein
MENRKGTSPGTKVTNQSEMGNDSGCVESTRLGICWMGLVAVRVCGLVLLGTGYYSSTACGRVSSCQEPHGLRPTPTTFPPGREGGKKGVEWTNRPMDQ